MLPMILHLIATFVSSVKLEANYNSFVKPDQMLKLDISGIHQATKKNALYKFCLFKKQDKRWMETKDWF